MPVLTTSNGSTEVAANQNLVGAGEELDIPFGCQEGFCGACTVTIESGAENLTEMNSLEKDQGCDGTTRLCCQMQITDGEVQVSV